MAHGMLAEYWKRGEVMFYLLVLYFKGSITKCPFRIPVSIRAGRKD